MAEDTLCRPASEIVRNGFAYWQRIRGTRLMPSRADLDPLHIPLLLPYVMLIDVLNGPLDFSFRLLGSRHERIVAGNYRGRRFSELPHLATGSAVWDHFHQVVTERQPLCGNVSYGVMNDDTSGRVEHCLMPLSNDGETVHIVFVVSAVSHLPLERQRPSLSLTRYSRRS
jgi:hypothetical protein